MQTPKTISPINESAPVTNIMRGQTPEPMGKYAHENSEDFTSQEEPDTDEYEDDDLPLIRKTMSAPTGNNADEGDEEDEEDEDEDAETSDDDTAETPIFDEEDLEENDLDEDEEDDIEWESKK